MLQVFILQWKRLKKRPMLVFMFVGLTFLFVFFMGGSQGEPTITVPTYSEEYSEEQLDEWVDRLNDSDTLSFETSDYETIEEDIRMNSSAYALKLEPESYNFLVGREDQQMQIVEQHVSQTLNQYDRLDSLDEEYPEADIEVEELVSVQQEALSDVGIGEVSGTYILVGMTFYFTMFMIMFLQTTLIEERKSGTWNRLIFSPVSKTKIYLANLLYYFTVGLGQVLLSFVVLTNLLGLELGTNYGEMLLITCSYLFTIVALGILVVALSPSVQAFQVIIPFVATAMAMLGGAFWPLDLISSDILLFIGELMPIKHAATSLNGVILEGQTFVDIIQPVGILLLMGVLFMGIGINLLERSNKT